MMANTRGIKRSRFIEGAAGAAAMAAAAAPSGAGGAGAARAGLAMAAFARAHASNAAPGSRMALMRAAAAEFGVPARLLLAVSYNETRWERQGGAPSVDGGYGLMNLTARTFPATDGRGDPAHPAPGYLTLAGAHDTLGEAARLLGVPAATLKTSQRQNVRGAAAVLAHDARALAGGRLPTSLGGWYGAVAKYSGATTIPTARA